MSEEDPQISDNIVPAAFWLPDPPETDQGVLTVNRVQALLIPQFG